MKTNKNQFYINNRTYFLIIVSLLAFACFFGVSIFSTKVSRVNPSQVLAAASADINRDGTVDVIDLSILLDRWNSADVGADLTENGTVDVFDLSILLGQWGVSIPIMPGASNTGVPAGVTLQPITTAYPDAVAQGYTVNAQGRVTITKDGGVYDSVVFPDGVVVRAKDVIIRKSRIVGGRSTFPTLPPEPTSWDHCRSIYLSGQTTGAPFIVDANDSRVSNLLIEDSEISVNENERSAYINNYMGHDTTMRRVNLFGGVDAIGTNNSYATTANFTIDSSYVHDLYVGQWSPGNYNLIPNTTTRMYCGYDAAHPEPTHNDGIQMHKGTGIVITGNTFFVNAVNAAQTTAGLMMNNAGNVQISNNHFKWGVCSINMPSTNLTLPIDVSNNTFYGNNGSAGTGQQDDTGCAIIRLATAGYTFSNNRWENGLPIKLTNGG